MKHYYFTDYNFRYHAHNTQDIFWTHSEATKASPALTAAAGCHKGDAPVVKVDPDFADPEFSTTVAVKVEHAEHSEDVVSPRSNLD